MGRPADSSSLEQQWLHERVSRSLFAVLPSWFFSLAFHALVLLLLAANLKSCGDGTVGGEGGEFREIGIYLKPTDAARPSDSLDETAEDESETTFSPAASENAPTSEVDDRPPVPLSLPSEAPPVIGGGAPPPASSVVPSDLRDFAQPNSVRSPAAAAAGGGLGAGSFMGIRDQGTRFVYVIDCSGSMAGSAMLVAKSELVASLQGLDRTQQFQVIFYNQSPHEMTLQGDRSQLYWATNINKTLSRQFISSIQPQLGTDHMPALKKALRLGPEVIFFLTDADEPVLRAADLNDLRKLNQGRTRIHCIEFGKGAELDVDNFLKRLARQNGGTYRYRDVTKFRRR